MTGVQYKPAPTFPTFERSEKIIGQPPALIYTPPSDLEDGDNRYPDIELYGRQSIGSQRQPLSYGSPATDRNDQLGVLQIHPFCSDNNNNSSDGHVLKRTYTWQSTGLTSLSKLARKPDMTTAMLSAAIPVDPFHSDEVDQTTSSSNHSSPSSQERGHSPNNRCDRSEMSSVVTAAPQIPILRPELIKTECISDAMEGSASIPVVVENQAESQARRDHGEMLLEKLEKEFKTGAPAALAMTRPGIMGCGESKVDRLGTPPALQIIMPTDPDVSVNSSSGLSESMLSPSGAAGMFNYNGDALSPEHPRNFTITPVIENNREVFYCHLCSFCGSTREQLNGHLEGHFEHQCDKCDYTSRTEGRLKQHIQRFHESDDYNEDESMDQTDDPSHSSFGNPMLASMEGYTTQSPTQRAPGRQKVYRCKQCEFSATVKTEFWNHARSHIKEDKILQCPKCPFVTEYKHHLEYHLRNHFGSKPFKCTKCNYACVNKSMLNSHMKSHTNIYQYRCADCTYATKYCHSLKLHLRKYSHKPASILNLDGTIDHDTSSLLTMKRSGPKSGKITKEEKRQELESAAPPAPPNLPQPGALPRFPPPPGMLPFWPMPAGMRPAPPPLIPVSMSNFFRGLMPPMLNHSMMHGHQQPKLEPRSQTSPNPEVSKDSDFANKSKEEFIHHSNMHHGGVPPPFNMFGGSMGVDKRGNNNISPKGGMWPAEMMGLNAAAVAKAALAMPPFGPPNMQFGGYPKPQQSPQVAQSPSEKMNGHSNSTLPSSSIRASSANGHSGDAPLDLTKSMITVENSSAEAGGRKRSRKGKAYKLDALCLRLQEKMDPDDEEESEKVQEVMGDDDSIPSGNDRAPSTESMDMSNRDEPDACGDQIQISKQFTVEEKSINGRSSSSQSNDENGNLNGQSTDSQSSENNNNEKVESRTALRGDLPEGSKERYSCPYCDISFTNCIMYTMHMGYHGYQNPFKCNMCGVESNDKVSFFLHIARAPHA